MKTEKEKMIQGELYLASDPELRQERLRASVTKDVPDRVVVAGNPAKIIRKLG